MSKMKYDSKPTLAAKSPIRLRPRRSLPSNSASLQTPPGSLTRSQKPILTWGIEESEIRPEYRSISCDLRVLARTVRDEFGNGETEAAGLGEKTVLSVTNSCPVFERGRFYEEYSARRNERLKRKKGETQNESKTGHHLGVTVESSKRRGSSKKLESLRKSVEIQTPRYLLRSMNKENKKPPLPVSVTATQKKTRAGKL
ncbi:hypothetical protein E1A91_A02G100500v1 [Gossypium mustelinum]|uniref:Uncharacterized protein n=3 Tax=Gossypium TaxID=3633 RepID=A0A2P5WEE8_GOSBA|nr:hypothetical protein ES319_A02G097200v1 [Gossypium barbadense]PPR89463.1 hypothetical protein GOBAR_AA31220 [Gossypium barbadense]TYH27934.1 hypothetical protein ES288_A02G106900v1 [Gossypium darwinii]TYJ46141.1 hypothetical protein E1A91_A02G100500v1 [Gossypium mustelinum]